MTHHPYIAKQSLWTSRFLWITALALGAFVWLYAGKAWTEVCNALLMAATAYLMKVTNDRYELAAYHNMVSFTFFVLLSSVLVFTHPFNGYTFIPLVFICINYELFRPVHPYGDRSLSLFTSLCLLSACGIWLPPMLWLIPVFIFGAVYLHSVTRKNLLSAITGVIMPHWLLLGYAVGMNDPDTVRRSWVEAIHPTLPDWSSWLSVPCLSWIVCTLMFVLSIVTYLPYAKSCRIHARLANNFMALSLSILLVANVFYFNHIGTLLSIEACLCSMLLPHCLLNSRRITMPVIFFVLLVILLYINLLWKSY